MRILVVDDHPLVRKGICSVLATNPELVVCGEAIDGRDGIRKARELLPDIVLMDISMPDLSGLEATREIKRHLPSAEILILSQHRHPEMARQAFNAGARGYVAKSSIDTDLLAAVGKIGKHETFVEDVSLAGTNHDLNAQEILHRSAAFEKALRESEERFRAIVETTPECMKLVSAQGILLQMNSAGLLMVGADCADAVVGKSVYDLIAEEDRERFRAFNERICRGERGRLEFDMIGLRGVRRHMETHGAPMRMSDSTIVQLAMTRDITERAHIEADLRKSEEQLRTLAVDLENQVRIRTRELEQRNSEVLQQSEQLQQLTNRLLQAQDDERRHVARELHDTAGQTLAVLGISVTALLEKAKQLAPQLANDVDEVQQIVLQLQQDIRTTSYLLHPPLLDENGLPAALQWYVKGIRERSGLDITLNISEEFGRLPQELELAIFRIVQECLVNIHRHSGSKVAEIVIAHEAQTVTLSVQDHGYGIPPEQLADIQTRGSGVGIRGMRERVRLFHGTTKIESNGCGTKVSATIPIPHGADATTDAGHEIKSHQEVG